MAFREFRRSLHQQAVDLFMRLAGQEVPTTPTTELSPEVRILRAKLMVEEVLETCNALGVRVRFGSGDRINAGNRTDQVAIHPHVFEINGELDIVEAVDGCCDVSVVTTGTLSALGVSDESVQFEVNQSNLAKFGPGGYRRDDGKWVKPPDHKPPELLDRLIEQGYRAVQEAAA